MIVEEMKQMAFKINNVIEDDFIWNNMFKNFILILSNTGMRVGEALQLRWRDVSTENVTYEGSVVCHYISLSVAFSIYIYAFCTSSYATARYA